MDIYHSLKNSVLDAGFTFDEWWNAVMRFIKNEFDTDAASWACAAQLAFDDLYESLIDVE